MKDAGLLGTIAALAALATAGCVLAPRSDPASPSPSATAPTPSLAGEGPARRAAPSGWQGNRYNVLP